jgi:glycosyltransferase involved in cell wall biosynthesis
MRLLFAIKGLHQSAGGAERVICDVSSYLADHCAHNVSLLTFDAPENNSFYPVSSAVQMISLGIGDVRAPTSLSVFLQRILTLRRVVSLESPDVVIAFMHSTFVPMSFALIGTGVPLVASEHIVMEYYRSRPLQFALFAAAVPFLRRITVISDVIAGEYPIWIRRKMVAVTNPLSPVFLREVNMNQRDSFCRILAVGRFSKRKDHQTLLAAFAMISETFPKWTLRIVGDGVLRPTTQREVERLGLQDRVSLPGIVSNVTKEMAEASFFALASKYESFGLVFAEAMACGKAVVAFADCQGVNNMIEDGETGLLVKGVDRVKAMADGLRRLMTNEELRGSMGQRARERVLQRFEIGHVCNRWDRILTDVRECGPACRD